MGRYTIKEKIIKIELWSPPLRKKNFTYTEDLKSKILGERSDASRVLIEIIEDIERKSQVLESAPSQAGVLDVSNMPNFDAPADNYRSDEPQSVIKEKKPKIRKLNPNSKFTIYDYSQVERDQTEKKVYDLINQDGYYNEILPYDADSDYGLTHINKTPVILLSILLVGIIVASIIILPKIL